MKRNLLFALFALIMGFGLAQAENVMIQVDHAANVKVTATYSGSIDVPLEDGMNRVTTLTSADSPLTIEPANGATITSVILNGSQELQPSGDRKYRVAIDNMMIAITTEGGGEVSSDVNVTFFAMGGPNDSAVVTYEGQTEPVPFGYSVAIPSGTVCKIAPAANYEITSVSGMGHAPCVNNGDGTWSYTANSDGDYVYVYTNAVGTDVTIDVDMATNVAVLASDGTESTPLTLRNGSNNVKVPLSALYLKFEPTEGSVVKSVSRNGNDLLESPYTGWQSMYEAGDVFVVRTQGPECDVTVKAGDDSQPDLDSYLFTLDGVQLTVKGRETVLKLHRGDKVDVTPRGLNSIKWVISNNPVYSAPFYFTVTGEETVSVYGEKATGLAINVDKAENVVIKQLNGFGDALTLTDGLNSFAVADIKNSLSISAAENCRILSITVDGNQIQAGTDGSYLVEAKDGTYIEIVSKAIPENINLTFMVNDNESGEPSAELAKHLTVKAGEEAISLTESVQMETVKNGTVISMSSEFGYVIDGITAGNNLVEVSEDETAYSFSAQEDCSVIIKMHQVVAPEGSSLVEFRANTSRVSFLPYNEAGDRLDGSWRAGGLGIIENGTVIKIKNFDSASVFLSITVNGEAVEFDADATEVDIKIEEDCTIDVVTGKRNADKISIRAYGSNNGISGTPIGDLFIKDGDQLVNTYLASPGEVIEFVAVPVNGYVLDMIKCTYPGEAYNITDTENLKFTVPNITENPEGDTMYYLFQGMFKQGEVPSYMISCYETYEEEVSDEELGRQVIGYVVVIDDNKEYMTRYFTEGTTVMFNIYPRDDYNFESLMVGVAPDSENLGYTNYYTVSGENADSSGIIPAYGKFVRKDGVEKVETARDMTYDAQAATLTSSASIAVYDVNGGLVLSSEAGVLSVADLPSGVYIGVSGLRVIKFAR